MIMGSTPMWQRCYISLIYMWVVNSRLWAVNSQFYIDSSLLFFHHLLSTTSAYCEIGYVLVSDRIVLKRTMNFVGVLFVSCRWKGWKMVSNGLVSSNVDFESVWKKIKSNFFFFFFFFANNLIFNFFLYK